MAFGATITITINAVPKILNRVNDSEPYSSSYYLGEADADYTVQIKHTVPSSRGASKESHLFRLDVNNYDATSGELVRRESVWTVLETAVGKQDNTVQEDNALGVYTFLDSAVVGDLLNRLS